MTAIERVIAVATGEVGYLEKKSNSQLDDKTANAGSNNYTKYARDIAKIPHFYNFDKNGFEWCTVFFDWCMIQAFGADLAKKMIGYPADSLGASCVWSVKYYKAIGRFSKTPQVGAQIFFGNDPDNAYHTGIVYKVDADRVYTIEGNTSGASGVVANGGGVSKKSYARNFSKICGYGMPKYELYKEEKVQPMATKKGKYFTDTAGHWAEADIDWCKEHGFMNGVSADKFNPDAPLTRAQAAVLIRRMKEDK